jgi:hypothetical protein
MPLITVEQLRATSLLTSLVIAAWLSYLFSGGLIVFGFSTPWTFAWLLLPSWHFLPRCSLGGGHVLEPLPGS